MLRGVGCAPGIPCPIRLGVAPPILRGVAEMPGPTLTFSPLPDVTGARVDTGVMRAAAAIASSFCVLESADASARSMSIGSFLLLADGPAELVVEVEDAAVAASMATASGPSPSPGGIAVCAPCRSRPRRSAVSDEKMPSRNR